MTDPVKTCPAFDPATHRPTGRFEPGADETGAAILIEVVEPIHLDEIKATRKAAATDLRWQKEIASIVINGVPVATDDRSKTLILGKRAKARESPAASFRWKASSGEWVELTGAQIIAIADAVADHVQACFDREGELHDLIDAAPDAAAVLAVDITAGWP